MNRKFDNLGRLVIPKEMRSKLGLNNGDEVTIACDGTFIYISNPNKEDKFEKWLKDFILRTENEKLEYVLKKYQELK